MIFELEQPSHVGNCADELVLRFRGDEHIIRCSTCLWRDNVEHTPTTEKE